MNTNEIKALNDRYLVNTYGERRLALVRGAGVKVWDADGHEYLDFMAGIAVCSLGHCHPEVTQAICEQARTLVHVSNLYYTEPQVRLAELLSTHSFADRWFFANCGATANEAALKLARRYWARKGEYKPEIVAAEQSFHGRTMATLTATGQTKYHEGFAPMLPGVRHVPYDSIQALERALTPQTGAVLLEPIQGEGGVRVASAGYLEAVRSLCTERGVLLIFDEVQTGMGRTGRLFAHEHTGVAPDIVTLAKALGNGVPIGAMGCTEEVAGGFNPGAHATTFGGNPLSSAAALAVARVMTRPGFLDRVNDAGAYFRTKLDELAGKFEAIVEVRGRGLMIGVELAAEVRPVISRLCDRSVIAGPAGPNVLRFVPPLVIERDDVDRAIEALAAALGEA